MADTLVLDEVDASSMKYRISDGGERRSNNAQTDGVLWFFLFRSKVLLFRILGLSRSPLFHLSNIFRLRRSGVLCTSIRPFVGLMYLNHINFLVFWRPIRMLLVVLLRWYLAQR
jgi:hypothetical protein